MEMPVYSTKADKVNLVSTFLMSGPDYGWLILVGIGGDGKTMATHEAVDLWRLSLGEDIKAPDSDIISLHCDGTVHKLVLMKKGTPIVKTIIHTNLWGPEWEFMAKEWNAKVVRFERGTSA